MPGLIPSSASATPRRRRHAQMSRHPGPHSAKRDHTHGTAVTVDGDYVTSLAPTVAYVTNPGKRDRTRPHAPTQWPLPGTWTSTQTSRWSELGNGNVPTSRNSGSVDSGQKTAASSMRRFLLGST